IESCIKKDILKDFLTDHYTEVLKMLNWEYDAEAERRVLTRDAMQQGMQRAAELLAELINAGTPMDEALNIVKTSSIDMQ
ncbi:MAG: hypothetical protein LBD23_03540, partial [Oscillospiraceae bacterium]|nr:hypothetical protein [Oscillospiraceae bacterium]